MWRYHAIRGSIGAVLCVMSVAVQVAVGAEPVPAPRTSATAASSALATAPPASPTGPAVAPKAEVVLTAADRQAIQARLERLDALLIQIDRLDAEADPLPQGMLQTTVRRADQYLAERQARQALAAELTALMADTRVLLASSAAVDAKLEERVRLLQAELANARQAPPPTAATPASLANELSSDRVSYYQLKVPGTFREVAALPEVYGDAAMWRLLQNGNPAVSQDGDEKIPAGTLLVVPNIQIIKSFDLK